MRLLLSFLEVCGCALEAAKPQWDHWLDICEKENRGGSFGVGEQTHKPQKDGHGWDQEGPIERTTGNTFIFPTLKTFLTDPC